VLYIHARNINTYERITNYSYLDFLETTHKGSYDKIRLHIPAIPYTITRDEYSHDAFTGKVKRFAKMMQSIKHDGESVFEVYHYGVETSESGADKEIQLLTKTEWYSLRIDAMQQIDPSLSRKEAEAKLLNPATIIGILSDTTTPLFREFNTRFYNKLRQYYRDYRRDIVCNPFGNGYDYTFNKSDFTVVETGIGYKNSCGKYRIFESYNWMSKTLGEENKLPSNYWFVIPHSFDSSEYIYTANPISERPKIGFLGRVVTEKGCIIISEVAKKFPHVDFILCGQGDPTQFLTSTNIYYKSPIHGSERSEFLGSCIATMCPTMYLEPFGCSAVESQLCGTPVISVDSGGYVETVEQFRTGLRCHTLADYCKGVQMAIDGAFDRKYVRERAVRLYDMYALAKQYEYVFKSVLDIRNYRKNGWYSPDCHLTI
jgi:glycosyltransferase involved in cell wall biosynthesis